MRRISNLLLLLLAPISELFADNVFNDNNNVYLTDGSVYIGSQYVLPVRMTNSVAFVAYQMDLYLPSGISVAMDGEKMAISGARMSATHVLESMVMSDGAIRLLCYSNDNSPLTGNSGEIAFITLDSTVNEDCELPVIIRNVRLASLDGNNDYVSSDDITCTLSYAHEFIPVSSITLDHTSYSGYPGDTFQLTATVLPDNASNRSVVWSSSNESIATVSQNGLVTLVGGGSAVIVAKTSDGTDLSAQCSVSSTTGNVSFADAAVKSICVSSWDTNGDGELSFEEAAAVLSLGDTFHGQTAIKSFCELRYFTGLASIPSGTFQGCDNLLAVAWSKVGVSVPSDIMSHPNGILYISSGVQSEYVGNTVTDGNSDNITLTFGQSLYIPEDFNAVNISCSRVFDKSTYRGHSSGWEAMVLPYDVDLVVHETSGEIYPFGSPYESRGNNFWLGSLTENGFVRSYVIKANVPFIISMPNSYEYGDQYNLNGVVTFSASNVDVRSTETLLSVYGPSFVMTPTYMSVESSATVYPLNDTEYNGYYAGSVFVSDSRAVLPFESYVQPLGSSAPQRYYAIGDNSTTAIRTMFMYDSSDDSPESALYNLYGLPVDDGYQGIVIQNGVKYIK